MAHPILHAKSNARKYGGLYTDYIHLHEWLDETKGWVPHSYHRMFRHHAQGIFEGEKIFGTSFTNSDGKIVYTRYCLEDHIKEDCYNYIPTAREWIIALESEKKPVWMLRTLDLILD